MMRQFAATLSSVLPTDDISLLVVNLERLALALCRRRLNQRLRDFRSDFEPKTILTTELVFFSSLAKGLV